MHGNSAGMDFQHQHRHGISGGMDVHLAWDFSWHGNSAGMDVQLAWDFSRHGISAGMDFQQAWDFSWNGNSVGMGFQRAWEFSSVVQAFDDALENCSFETHSH